MCVPNVMHCTREIDIARFPEICKCRVVLGPKQVYKSKATILFRGPKLQSFASDFSA